jgi:hypothetical protein
VVLLLIARPVAVVLSTLPFRFKRRELSFLSLGGAQGSGIDHPGHLPSSGRNAQERADLQCGVLRGADLRAQPRLVAAAGGPLVAHRPTGCHSSIGCLIPIPNRLASKPGSGSASGGAPRWHNCCALSGVLCLRRCLRGGAEPSGRCCARPGERWPIQRSRHERKREQMGKVERQQQEARLRGPSLESSAMPQRKACASSKTCLLPARRAQRSEDWRHRWNRAR